MPHTNPKRSLATVAVYSVLVCYLVAVVYPMVWMLGTSLKTDREIFSHPFSPPGYERTPDGDKQWVGLRWDNFSNAWTGGHFGRYFLNSVLVTAATVAATLLLAAMAAYALSRFAFAAARPVYFYFLAGLMIPLQLAIVPLFFQMKALHLLGSHTGLLLAYVAFGLPFAVFVLTGFFRSLPASLHEAALIDGAGEFRAFWSVMLPLARPGMITVGIFTFLATWNEFFMAFMFLSGEGSAELRTLPLGMADVTIVSQYRSDWGMAFAGLVLMMLPTLLVYIILQGKITKGLMVGAVKG